MVTQESLMGMSQHFFTPDIVSRISEIVGQSKEKTLAGLKSIVPAFVSGIVEKGSTPEGAASLVDLVNTHQFEHELLPDENNLKDGSDVIHNIFGSNLEPTLSRLSVQSKLDKATLTKLMGVIAPICMGIVGAKIKRESMNMTGLMSFIKGQKQELAGYSSANSEYYNLSGRNPDKDYRNPREKSVWFSWILAIIVAGGIMVWWSAVQYRSPATIKSPVTTVTTAPIATLEDFLANPDAKVLPKHFYFDSIYFLGETTRLSAGFSEINYVAEVLKKYPNARVRLVGIGENVGTDRETIVFAQRRADLVRNEIVARGASPDQITTSGLAGASPAGYKTTTPGNASFQRMELVVTSF